MTMIACNWPEETYRDLLEYANEFIDNACSGKMIAKAEQNKNRIKHVLKRDMANGEKIIGEIYAHISDT